MKKRFLSVWLIGIFTIASITCYRVQVVRNGVDTIAIASAQSVQHTSENKRTKTPKYIFLFIGDGMSYPQIQLTNYYLSASADSEEIGETVSANGEEKEILTSKNNLMMMDFPIGGSAQTYNSSSFVPDSASTATTIATGKKTWSNSINVSRDFTQEYDTI